MSVTVTGIKSVEDMLFQVDSDWKKKSMRHIYRKAAELKDIAHQMAPVDDGDLEAAIKILPETMEEALSTIRNSRGQFAKKSVIVYIDMEKVGEDGKKVGEYAYVIHEYQTPSNATAPGYKKPFALGPRSQEKASQSRYQVGGLFMDRACEEVANNLELHNVGMEAI